MTPLGSALNTRAVAGFRLVGGRRIRPGILYRSSALSYLSDEDGDHAGAPADSYGHRLSRAGGAGEGALPAASGLSLGRRAGS
ncbi:tyrosine-protein phosphatase [Actinopolymorpha singaporensis]